MRRRWLVLLFPWVALHYLRLHVQNGTTPVAEQRDWDRGYERAWWEVGQCIGVKQPHSSERST